MTLPLSPAELRRLQRRFSSRQRGQPVRGHGVEPPRSVEAGYYRALKAIVRKLESQVSKKIFPLLKKLEPEYIADSPQGILLGALTSLEQLPTIAEATQARIAVRMAKSTEAFNRVNFVKDINDVIGVSLRSVITAEGVEAEIAAAIEKNVSLIESIPTKYHQELRKAILEGIEQGDDFFSIRKKILEVGESTDKRARFIARDQVAKLNSAVTRVRQTKSGITHYIWRTSKDDRVRPSHEENEGKRFAWSDPPSTGHPGEDYNCRCTAEPDLSGILDGLEEAA